MFTLKFRHGPESSYTMFQAETYSAQLCSEDVKPCKYKDATKVCVSIWPKTDQNPSDLIVEEGQVIFVMNDAGQTIDIIKLEDTIV